jgi:hypothetical protein
MMLSMVACLLLAACAIPNGATTPSGAAQAAPTACAVDADCTVKNVGNCCGYYPQCVNVAHQPDPAGVQAACEREGRSSVCGFPEISGCRCEAGRCVAEPGAAPAASLQ